MPPRQPSLPPPAATEHVHLSAALAAGAVRAATKARPTGTLPVAQAVVRYQVAGAVLAEKAVAAMLDQQAIDAQAEALLNSVSFTTEANRLLAMIEATTVSTADAGAFERLVSSLVQDATRAAESVSVAVRPRVAYVRVLTLPSCSRCAVLAGRVYRYSTGFLRHPNCDCVMLPTTVGNDLVPDIGELVRQGQIRGLSQADMKALDDGADLGSVVNIRRHAAGLREAGQVLARNGKPSPAGIYRLAGDDRAAALELLKRFGYVR